MEENKTEVVAEVATEKSKVDDKVEKIKVKKLKNKKLKEPKDNTFKVDLDKPSKPKKDLDTEKEKVEVEIEDDKPVKVIEEIV